MISVVDCETTGFGRYDRLVEIAVVQMDTEAGNVVDEFDTLLNPERDVGPTDIHRVTPTMVEAAPTFGEIAATLARRLHGTVLVAHNLSFDARMLDQEFNRLGTTFSTGTGHCTLRLTSEKLGLACRRHGIPLSQAHRALADARATAELLRTLHPDDGFGGPGGTVPCRIGYIDGAPNPRTLRRPPAGEEDSGMVRMVSQARYPYCDEAIVAYLDALDWVLDDHEITPAEREEMARLAEDLGLSAAHVEAAHARYFESIVAAALRDRVVTEAEHLLMKRVAAALNIEHAHIPSPTELPRFTGLPLGARVCFSGSGAYRGRPLTRDYLQGCAARAGLQPVASVTKKGCDILVVFDLATGSGKARKARSYGIPLMRVGSFMRQASAPE